MKIEQKDVKTGKIKIINAPDPKPIDPGIIKTQRRQDIKNRINTLFADYLLDGLKNGTIKEKDIPTGIRSLIADYNAQ